jgi:hypothetical protein
MTMSRATAAVFLHGQFSDLATEISQAETDDSADGYGPDIDQAFRQLETDEDDLATASATQAQIPAFVALCEYYALRRFARRLALRADIKAGTMAKGLGKQADTLQALMAEAAQRAAGLGYPVDGAAAWSIGQINLDYIEPEPTT